MKTYDRFGLKVLFLYYTKSNDSAPESTHQDTSSECSPGDPGHFVTWQPNINLIWLP